MNLRTFKNIWEQLNNEVFAGLLFPPRFYRTRSHGEYASYQAGITVQSIIHCNFDTPGNLARSAMYHEMVHQYVEEFLGVEEENDHGPVFIKQYKKFQPAGVNLNDFDEDYE